jgi:CO/xanthine dehydrogenase FAD-binding subunit
VFTVRELVQPESITEAYETLVAGADNVALAGCAFLRLGNKKIDIAVDLSRCNLDFMTEGTDVIEIGAMTTLREIETNSLVRNNFDGMLSHSVEHIIGVQFRSAATLGAPVFSRYGFSDPLTALLVLDTSVDLVKGGRMALVDFLRKPYTKDILTKIIIKKDGRRAAFQGFRNAASDYSLLNAAVSRLGSQWTIAVGARPMAAQIAVNTSAAFSAGGMTAEAAGDMAAEELAFSSNTKASAEYRKALCKTLVARAIQEVEQCK